MKIFLHHSADLFDYNNHATMESQLIKGFKCQVGDNNAVLQARKAVTRDNTSDSHVALGDALCKQLRYREAINCYDKAASLDSANRIAYRRRAVCYLQLLRTKEAEQAFVECQRLGFDRLDCQYHLALCCYYEGRFDESAEHLIECLEYCKTDNEMHIAVVYWLALSLVRQGKSYDYALKVWNNSSDVGQHLGYLYFLQQLRDGKQINTDMHFLTQSIYQYGKYCLLRFEGKLEQAAEYLNKYLIDNKMFWGSFAYLAALADQRGNFSQSGEYPTLQDFFSKYNKVAVAFSGGVDSAYLLYSAKQCGAEVHAYFVKSQFQPDFELQDAKKVAEFCQTELTVLKVNVLTESVVANPPDRCFYCKQSIISAIKYEAQSNGSLCVVEGTNATDDVADRAGYRALQQMGVLSPLRICGIGKSEIRQFARKVGLPNADKVSYACLATRIATGEHIEEKQLSRVAKAEQSLKKAFNLKVFRVRVKGNKAVLQSCMSEIDYVKKQWTEIKRMLLRYFDDVELSDSLHGEE